MELTALCSRLLMFSIVLLGAHIQKRRTQTDALRVTVDRLQFFEYESVSFLCDAPGGLTQLARIRSDEKPIKKCDINSRSTLNCTIETAYETDGGVYWCETERGEKSNTVNITVTAGHVILKSPAVPVSEGNDVTLSCRNRSTNLPADFYKDGVLVKTSPTGEIVIYNVSKSDEGFYDCSVSDVGASPRSWLSVKVSEEDRPVQHGSSDVLISLLVFIFLIMALLLLLLGFLMKHRASVDFCLSSKTLTTATYSEEDQTGENDADDENTLTYAVVVTKQRKNKDEANAAEYTSPRLESNHSRKPQEERDKDGPVYSTLNIKAAETGGEKPY